MIRILLHSALLLFCLNLHAQQDKEKIWQSEKDYLKYRKTKEYKGPDDWYGSYPTDMKDEDPFQGYGGYSSGSGGHGIQYSPQQIQKDRERYKGFERGGGQGTVKTDPKVERPDPITAPDIDAPDIDLPDLDVDAPTIPMGFWRFILFLLVFAALVIIAYLIFKNRKPTNKKLIVDVENEWNPEVISKTELELRLEEATERDDYRECIRIYFTFILKELIKKNWIRWKKDKTNHQYVVEMARKPNSLQFMECVRIYDLVWYGEYHIDREIYEMLKPHLEYYYRSLEPTNE